MADFLFYLFAFLTVLASAGVVANRNAVNAALCLLLSFAGIAALFTLLDAGLLAFVFVLVYAGAVVVLFLFVVMLLDVQGGDRRHPYRALAAAAAAIALTLLTLGLVSFLGRGRLPEGSPAAVPGFKEFSARLFTTYLLPVEVTGFLLLVAMLGVVVISRRLDGKEAAR
ncbi:MAG TPA: NADH-quinone oxidoreductase subunit J [Opitutaceae bacterium]|nr:NADH-quinone oxidoreductase subunit J [Opitutaceae bacterium]